MSWVKMAAAAVGPCSGTRSVGSSSRSEWKKCRRSAFEETGWESRCLRRSSPRFSCSLLVLWLRREPFAAGGSAETARPGSAQLLAQLPGASSAGLDDPWAEAERRRLAGDLAGAIIYLFAHQLISLDRAGLIRLAPGWTGRQYVRWLRDPVLVDSLGATLGLFEEIYYGHRLPSQVAFEHVWSRAQALEDRRRALEVSR